MKVSVLAAKVIIMADTVIVFDSHMNLSETCFYLLIYFFIPGLSK